MASAREQFTATPLNDGTVLLDGGSDGTGALSTAYLYMSSQLAKLNAISIQTTRKVGLGGPQQLVATGYLDDGEYAIACIRAVEFVGYLIAGCFGVLA